MVHSGFGPQTDAEHKGIENGSRSLLPSAPPPVGMARNLTDSRLSEPVTDAQPVLHQAGTGSTMDGDLRNQEAPPRAPSICNNTNLEEKAKKEETGNAKIPIRILSRNAVAAEAYKQKKSGPSSWIAKAEGWDSDSDLEMSQA